MIKLIHFYSQLHTGGSFSSGLRLKGVIGPPPLIVISIMSAGPISFGSTTVHTSPSGFFVITKSGLVTMLCTLSPGHAVKHQAKKTAHALCCTKNLFKLTPVFNDHPQSWPKFTLVQYNNQSVQSECRRMILWPNYNQLLQVCVTSSQGQYGGEARDN